MCMYNTRRFSYIKCMSAVLWQDGPPNLSKFFKNSHCEFLHVALGADITDQILMSWRRCD